MGELSFQSLVDLNQRHDEPERFLHILGVTHTALALAFIHGKDPDRAAAAALLHDSSKPLSPKELEADLDRMGAALADEDRPYPKIWHGIHAAAVARRNEDLSRSLGVESLEEVARAVEVHTTADREMSPLAKLLFVADAIEPGRAYAGVDELRRLARTDLDAAFRGVLRRKIEHVREKGGTLSPRAERARIAFTNND